MSKSGACVLLRRLGACGVIPEISLDFFRKDNLQASLHMKGGLVPLLQYYSEVL